jgi:XRE family transcriptional regulator, regulator of sulfur utilization
MTLAPRPKPRRRRIPPCRSTIAAANYGAVLNAVNHAAAAMMRQDRGRRAPTNTSPRLGFPRRFLGRRKASNGRGPRPITFDIPNEIVYNARERAWRAMGVEGKDRAKVLEGGAASLSNQLGQAVLKLRKGYGLSLADLSQHSGVAKSIISQIERNETNPTLTTIWRLAHALDVSIESMLRGTEEGPFIEHLGRGTTPIFVSDDGLCRLAVIGWLKTVDWLQWYDFQADPGGVLESAAHLRGSVECLSVLDGELDVEVGETTATACGGETLRYRCDMPHRIRNLSEKPAHATMVCILKAAMMD